FATAGAWTSFPRPPPAHAALAPASPASRPTGEEVKARRPRRATKPTPPRRLNCWAQVRFPQIQRAISQWRFVLNTLPHVLMFTCHLGDTKGQIHVSADSAPCGLFVSRRPRLPCRPRRRPHRRHWGKEPRPSVHRAERSGARVAHAT